MLFNIHAEKEAQDTLKRLTSIPFSVWERESAHFNEYKYCDDFLEATIKKYDKSLPRFDDIDFVISHITTSANACREIKENGLIDLGSVYNPQIPNCACSLSDTELKSGLIVTALNMETDILIFLSIICRVYRILKIMRPIKHG